MPHHCLALDNAVLLVEGLQARVHRLTLSRALLFAFGLAWALYIAVKDLAVWGILQRLDDRSLSNVSVQEEFGEQVAGGSWNIKRLTMTPIVSFFLEPIAEATVASIPLAQYPLLTPDAVTVSHCFLSLCTFPLLTSTNLVMQRVGAFLFLVRQLLDEADGTLARAWTRLGTTASAYGYYLDGYADAGATVLLVAAIYVINERTLHHHGTVCQEKESGGAAGDEESQTASADLPLDRDLGRVEPTAEDSESDSLDLCSKTNLNTLYQGPEPSDRREMIVDKPLKHYLVTFLLHCWSCSENATVILKILLIQAMASYNWNMGYLKYTELLVSDLDETGASTHDPFIRRVQASFLGSWTTSVIFHAWQLLGPTFILLLAAFAIFFERSLMFCRLYSDYGLKLTLLLSCVTRLHASEIDGVLEVLTNRTTN